MPDLETLIEPITRGDPESPLRWVGKSSRKLARALRQQGHQISHQSVAVLLKQLDYSLQANKKRDEGTKEHPDRNAQFKFIDKKTEEFSTATSACSVCRYQKEGKRRQLQEPGTGVSKKRTAKRSKGI